VQGFWELCDLRYRELCEGNYLHQYAELSRDVVALWTGCCVLVVLPMCTSYNVMASMRGRSVPIHHAFPGGANKYSL
jgi:hypothetical protein